MKRRKRARVEAWGCCMTMLSRDASARLEKARIVWSSLRLCMIIARLWSTKASGREAQQMKHSTIVQLGFFHLG